MDAAPSSWLKICLGGDLKSSRMKDFNMFITEYLHHGWKTFLNIDDLKCTRIKDFKTFITEYLHHGWRKFWISMIWNTPEWRISMKDLDHIKWYVDTKKLCGVTLFKLKNNTLIRRILPNMLCISHFFLVRRKGAFWEI